MIASTRSFNTRPAEQMHAGFLVLLPRIETHALIAFRHLRCPDRRADAVAETVALAWKWYLDLARRGKDAARFPGSWPQSLRPERTCRTA